MPGELAEGRQIRIPGLEVSDVRLILHDGNTVDGRRRPRRVGGLADTALRGVHSIAGPVHRHAGVEVIEIAGIEVVLDDLGIDAYAATREALAEELSGQLFCLIF